MTTSNTRRDGDDSTERKHLPDVPDRSRLPSGPSPGRLDRRDYLKALGAAGAAGSLVGATAGSAAAQEDWEADADARIEEHRKSDLEVVVEDPDGNSVPDADVEVEMHEHEFGFGTAVNAEVLLDASDDDPYREHLLDLFNKAVLENAHKWRMWEENEQRAHDATDWLLENDFDVRGHVCVWGSGSNLSHRDQEGSWAIPDDVEQAIEDRDAQTIRDRSMQHIEDIINYYGDDIEEWDVVNEALHAHDLQVGVYGDQIDLEEEWTGDVIPWTSEILADWYEHARQVADENDVTIATNDYNTLVGWGYTRDWYPAQHDHLIEDNGIDIDSIGFQGHAQASTGEVWTDGNDGRPNPDGRLSYEQLNDTLSLYEDYDADLKVTEFDTYEGDDWGSGDMTADEDKAQTLYTYLKTIFAHPQATDFLIWGYWDGRHWENDAPLFYDDWSEKPAYDVWTNLVFDEWWTEVPDGTTGDDGAYSVSAFHGDHDVTASAEGESTTERVSVSDGGTQVTVTLPVDGVAGACEDLPDDQVEEVDGQTVCDVNDDGYYRDVTGDGEVGQGDVAEFFTKQHRGAWKQPDMFDFSENGAVTHGDVVELFDYVGLNG